MNFSPYRSLQAALLNSAFAIASSVSTGGGRRLPLQDPRPSRRSIMGGEQDRHWLPSRNGEGPPWLVFMAVDVAADPEEDREIGQVDCAAAAVGAVSHEHERAVQRKGEVECGFHEHPTLN